MIPPLAWLCPTLPTLIEDQHRHHRTGMLTAFTLAGLRLRAFAPRVIVAVSARWRSVGPFMVDAGKRHRTVTDYSGFGVEVRHDCDGDPALARAIVAEGVRARVRVAAGQRGVDSGVSVPLHLLAPERGTRVVPVSVADQSEEACRVFGAVLRRTVEAWPEKVALVVGGNLSFNEHAWRLGREIPESGEVDEQVLDGMTAADWTKLRAIDSRQIAQAQPEAGLRHLFLLQGFVGEDIPGDVRCYQAMPGIGAALVEWVLDPVAAATLPVEAPEPPPAPPRVTRSPRPATRASATRPARNGASRPRTTSRSGNTSRPRSGSRPATGARPTSGFRTPRGKGPARGPRRGPKRRG